jgi:hypothetical protein
LFGGASPDERKLLVWGIIFFIAVLAVIFFGIATGDRAEAAPCQGLGCSAETQQSISVASSPSFWGVMLAWIIPMGITCALVIFFINRLMEKNKFTHYFERERRSLIPIESVPERESLE